MLFAAVGTGVAAFSLDGKVFTSTTIPGGTWTAVTSNGSLLVAVGTNVCATSPDGINWTTRTIPAGSYTAIAFSPKLGLFVAIGTNVVATSPDGITWTSRTVPAGDYGCIGWNGTQFTALTLTTGSETFSTDGINWSSHSGPNGVSGQWRAVAWNGAIFCAVGTNGTARSCTSTDGVNWTLAGAITGTPSLYAVVWTGLQFVAIGDTPASVVYVSTDGLTWTQYPLPVTGTRTLAWSGTVMAGIKSGSTQSVSSPNGINWTVGTAPNATWSGIASLTTFLTQRAVALDSHRARITLSFAPLSNSAAAAGDALNPDTWVVTDLVTGAISTVLQVTKISSTVFDIFVAAPFASDAYQITCPTLLNSDGTVLALPVLANFSGVALAVPVAPVNISIPVDVKNVASPASAGVPGGALVIGSDGDYVFEFGESLLRKLVMRRLTTAPGDFFHLPDYGLGLQEKTLAQPATLPALKRAIEQQMSQEPELQDVTASIVLIASTGTLQVTVRGTVRTTGQPFTTTSKISTVST